MMRSLRAGHRFATSLIVLLAIAAVAACATTTATTPVPEPEPPPVPGTPEARRTPELPAIPSVDGPLRLEVGYPPENATIAVRDSNFIFGSTGSGRTQLSINSAPVQVTANGGFLAFVPVPADGVYRLQATLDSATASLERRVRVPPPPAPPNASARIIAPYPTGALALRQGETVEIGFRAPSGGAASVTLPDGRRIPLIEQGSVVEPAVGDEFRTQTQPTSRALTMSRYAALVVVTTPLVSRDTSVARPRIGSLVQTTAPPPTAKDALLELVLANDTARAPLRLNLGLVDASVPRTGVVMAPPGAPHDWTTRGRNDTSGPFHYFWPAGARLTIIGERDGFFRVRLAEGRNVWVPVSDVRLFPAGAPTAGGGIGSVRFSPQPGFIDLRIPLPERLPFEVVVADDRLHIDVFGATSRVNFFQYGGLDPLVERAEWSQPADEVFRVSVDLAVPVWGYDTFYDAGGGLVLRIRRPPAIDVDAPLRGLFIAVDPGHGGEDHATRGPTGWTEADANLGVALKLQQLLEAAGARVLMTRTRDTTVPLGDRPRIAADSNVHILVSVHNNAFPDGVNPWANAGTSVYYFHPQSAELARLLQQQLLDSLGLRDIGYGRADLALVRPTWMPAVLSETMFMMIPQQEAALRDPATQERIAAAHVRALEAFVLRRARH